MASIYVKLPWEGVQFRPRGNRPIAFATDRIDHYRRLLRSEISTVTRRSVEWLFVNAVREMAGLDPIVDTGEDDLGAPALLATAGHAVDEAVHRLGAQFGNLQLYVAKHDVLVLLVSRNFTPEFIDRFSCFSPDGRTACSRAFASARRVLIENVANDELFEPHRPAAREAGFQAVQSTPIKGTLGKVIAVLSTHFAAPRTFTEDELGVLDAQVETLSRDLAREWA